MTTVGKGSRHRRDRRGGAIARAPATRRWRVLAAVGAAGLALALTWVVWRPAAAPGQQPATSPTPAAQSSPGPQAYSALVGQWVRPDGGYLLTVSEVTPEGRATVSYNNPRLIRVAHAETRRNGDHVGLFVEFDDANYPGSTYTLTYDPAVDQLKGIYYQAAQRARYEVFFERRR